MTKPTLYLAGRSNFRVPQVHLEGFLIEAGAIKDFKELLRKHRGAAVVIAAGNLQFFDTEAVSVALNNAKPSSLHIFIPDAGTAGFVNRLLSEEVLKVTTVHIGT
jgi:hypothetical protein